MIHGCYQQPCYIPVKKNSIYQNKYKCTIILTFTKDLISSVDNIFDCVESNLVWIHKIFMIVNLKLQIFSSVYTYPRRSNIPSTEVGVARLDSFSQKWWWEKIKET